MVHPINKDIPYCQIAPAQQPQLQQSRQVLPFKGTFTYKVTDQQPIEEWTKGL